MKKMNTFRLSNSGKRCAYASYWDNLPVSKDKFFFFLLVSRGPGDKWKDEQWRREIMQGSQIDALNTPNRWNLAEVLEVESDKVLVHYEGYGDQYKTWIPLDSPYIMPARMEDFQGNEQDWRQHVQVGDYIEELDGQTMWYEAVVREVREDTNQVLVHFVGLDEQHDQWMPQGSPNIAERNTHTPPPKTKRQKYIFVLLLIMFVFFFFLFYSLTQSRYWRF
eukprot:g47391.t1